MLTITEVPADPHALDQRSAYKISCDGCTKATKFYSPDQWVFPPEQVESWKTEHARCKSQQPSTAAK